MKQRSPCIVVICVGTELLTGKINTHLSYLGLKLAEIGLEIAYEYTVSDDPKVMSKVFLAAWKNADVVICCGGLGPTFDDITRDIWAHTVKRPLVRDLELISDIERKFIKRNIKMPLVNQRQADVIQGATVLPNPLGTAPGQTFKSNNKTLYLLPGPTRELVPMAEKHVLPALKRNFTTISLQKSFHSFGTAESILDELVRPIIKEESITSNKTKITFGILASSGIVSVKFNVIGDSKKSVQNKVTHLTIKIRQKLSPYIFAEGNPSLAHAVMNKLRKRHETCAFAESCTGGLLTKMLTDEAGASQILKESVITYSNESKEQRLNVRKETLKKHGAVSSNVAIEMAKGLLKTSGASHAISITGIAGPSGGTKEKPVGLVYIGFANKKKSFFQKHIFHGDRNSIRQRAALTALSLLFKTMDHE